MKRQGLGRTRTTTIYSEKYISRARHVTANEAASILKHASCIYAVEQGEIEIPSFENQRRLICVLRFERIVPPPQSGNDIAGRETCKRCGKHKSLHSPLPGYGLLCYPNTDEFLCFIGEVKE